MTVDIMTDRQTWETISSGEARKGIGELPDGFVIERMITWTIDTLSIGEFKAEMFARLCLINDEEKQYTILAVQKLPFELSDGVQSTICFRGDRVDEFVVVVETCAVVADSRVDNLV